jgi:hypothetical protein
MAENMILGFIKKAGYPFLNLLRYRQIAVIRAFKRNTKTVKYPIREKRNNP